MGTNQSIAITNLKEDDGEYVDFYQLYDRTGAVCFECEADGVKFLKNVRGDMYCIEWRDGTQKEVKGALYFCGVTKLVALEGRKVKEEEKKVYTDMDPPVYK